MASGWLGAPEGAADGVTELDAGDAAPLPTEFTARILNWYAVPLFSPVNV